MTRRKGELEKIGAVLPQALGRFELPGKVLVQLLWERWPELMGPLLAAKTAPRDLRQRTLWLSVASASWSNELQLMKPKLLAKLNAAVPQLNLKDIRFVLKTAARRPGRPVTKAG